ncbi:VOC family protein [Telmatospirillum sp. J64-1]|uniref:VOC family protein n=1 Tax=Telmatospirillum sp. J64-1 TaxID=2502183 RepID=UPI00115C8D62|nr:VOC family protein [Telmatospirillum sp. J64-1]
MIDLHQVCYARLGTRDLAEAVRFATEIVGLELVRQEGKRAYLRADNSDHTLCYFEGDPRDHTLAFELSSADALDAAAAELERAEYRVVMGTPDEAEERRVSRFIAFRDPTGNKIELVVRPQRIGRRYFPARDAGITSFSHVGLCSTNPPRDEVFWTTICNGRVSDWIGTSPLLRIDEVHHTLALFPTDRPGIQHINHQVESIDDVMRSWYFMQRHNVNVVFGPGRHPTSGAMFLYFEGPEGMIFEYSTGVALIHDEASHHPRQFPAAPEGFCMWGSKPNIKEFK